MSSRLESNAPVQIYPKPEPTRRRRSFDWKGWLPMFGGVLAAVIAATLWISAALGGKADATVGDRVTRMEQDMRWLKAAMWANSQKLGVDVPPPPMP